MVVLGEQGGAVLGVAWPLPSGPWRILNTSGSSSHTPETCAIKRAWLHNMHLTNDFDMV